MATCGYTGTMKTKRTRLINKLFKIYPTPEEVAFRVPIGWRTAYRWYKGEGQPRSKVIINRIKELTDKS